MPTSDIGQRTRVGPADRGPSSTKSARSWAVFPSPMSSARQAPRPRSPRKPSHPSPRSWYGRNSPTKPSGVGRATSRRSSAPARSSPSHPSASTAATGRSPDVGASPIAVRNTSPADIRSPSLPLFSTAAIAAEMSSSRSSTHWPRKRTRGCLRRANSLRSASPILSSPRTTSQSISHSPSRPMDVTTPAPIGWVLAFSRRLMRALEDRHQGGASTPNPACSRIGALLPRKKSAPAESINCSVGVAAVRAEPSEGTRRAARPRPRRRCSSG